MTIASNYRQRVMALRASRLAEHKKADAAEARLLDTVVIVEAAGQLFGLPASKLQEVGRTAPLARLPSLPPWMPGILQVRGRVVTAVDLAGYMGIAPSSGQSHMAVALHTSGALALVFDSVVGFRDIKTSEQTKVLVGGAPESRHLVAYSTRDMMAVLNLDLLFGDPRVVVGA